MLVPNATTLHHSPAGSSPPSRGLDRNRRKCRLHVTLFYHKDIPPGVGCLSMVDVVLAGAMILVMAMG